MIYVLTLIIVLLCVSFPERLTWPLSALIDFQFHPKNVIYLFQVGGIALMAVGGVALKKVGDVKHVFEDGDHPGFFPAAVIALGALVFIIAFFGCCGAIRESRNLAIMFSSNVQLTYIKFLQQNVF